MTLCMDWNNSQPSVKRPERESAPSRLEESWCLGNRWWWDRKGYEQTEWGLVCSNKADDPVWCGGERAEPKSKPLHSPGCQFSSSHIFLGIWIVTERINVWADKGEFLSSDVSLVYVVYFLLYWRLIEFHSVVNRCSYAGLLTVWSKQHLRACRGI